MDSSKEKVFKIALVGDSAAGKTSIVQRFASKSFTINPLTTIGVDFVSIFANCLVSISRSSDVLISEYRWHICNASNRKLSLFLKEVDLSLVGYSRTREVHISSQE
jgi:GTPase SAR1 family protein